MKNERFAAPEEKIICVVGPTASGKSALAVELARRFDGEVISCDSMQLYRGMDIGTAKTTPQEMRGIPHHLTDILDIHEPFSVSDYVKIADECVKNLCLRAKCPVFCGGTGLYIDSFVSGMSFGDYAAKPGVREELTAYAASCGAKALHERLRTVDRAAAEKIEPANVKRVVRALEVYESTGITATEWNARALQNAVGHDALYIGLVFSDRAKLYERIERRVDAMMEAGLLEEAERLIRAGLRDTPTAGQAIGYKEFYPYFDGTASLSDCVERLKINSRHYAKRQLTWFARNKALHSFAVDTMTPEELCKRVSALCESELAAARTGGVTASETCGERGEDGE